VYSIITVIVVVIVFALVAYWALRGRGKQSRPEAGPTMPDLSTAEEVMKLEKLHDEGTITDAEYHEARSRLLS
jgi:uncharacterized membrane protein